MTQYPIVACPACAAPVEWRSDNPTRPFCGERCKLIDLGAWAAESHSIPGEPLLDELFSETLQTAHH